MKSGLGESTAIGKESSHRAPSALREAARIMAVSSRFRGNGRPRKPLSAARSGARRMIARVPSVSIVTRSPAFKPVRRRTAMGKVICPLCDILAMFIWPPVSASNADYADTDA
jgi:hypothetical protein